MAVAVTTTVCLTLAFRVVDVDAVGRALNGARSHYLALAVLLLLGNLLVALARFRVVLHRFGHLPAWMQLHGAFCVGLIGNLFVLNFIGQSIGRAGALTSSGVPIGVTIIATLVERVLAAGTLAVAGLCAAWFLLPRLGFEIAQGGAYSLSLVGAMTLAAVFAGAVSYRRGSAVRTVSAVGRNVARFWSVGLLTVLTHCFMLGSYIAVLLALGLDTATLEVAGAVLLVMLAAAFPISVSGWGVRELSALAILGAIGIDSVTSLAAAFVVGVLSLGVSLVVALPGLFLVLNPGRRLVPEPERASHARTSTWNTRLVMGCGVLTAVTMFFQVQVQSDGGQVTVNAADLFALLGLGTLILLLVDSRDRLAALPCLFMGALLSISLLLAYGLLLGYWSFGANAWAVINRGIGWLIVLGYVAMGLSIALLDPEKGRRLVLRLFVAAGTAVAVSQLGLLIFGNRLPVEASQYPLSGYAGSPSAFGFQMTMTAVAAIVADRLGVLGAGRRGLTVVCFLTGLAVYFAGSRMGVGGFAVLLVLAVAFAPSPERRSMLVTALSVAVGVAVAAAAIVNAPSLIDASGDIWSRDSFLDLDSVLRSERWRTIGDGWHLWLDRPIFGQGLGAYVESRVAASEPVAVVHSVPIWLMAEMGLVGLVVGLGAFGCLALSACRLMRAPVHRAWGVGVFMALICWGAASLVHDLAFQRAFWFFLALALGFLPSRKEPGLAESPRLLSRPRHRYRLEKEPVSVWSPWCVPANAVNAVTITGCRHGLW